MEKIEMPDLINLTDYVNKIREYDYDRLETEKNKIKEKMFINYTVVGVGTFWQEREEISDNPDELNRIYLRKRVAVVSKCISSLIDDIYVDFQGCWEKINEGFSRTTECPDFATARLHGKRVPFADKLSFVGIRAYERYLMFLAKCFEKFQSIVTAINDATILELTVDAKFDRSKFYSNKFLPANIDSIYGKVMKVKTINERMKELGNVQKIEK